MKRRDVLALIGAGALGSIAGRLQPADRPAVGFLAAGSA